ncbi:hypothetical protein MSAN_02051900 [Mycena sanguinolenta]|uniref:Uncharacterized protein n=1 Tax=Mycena sanguinolenta TaxID=230812 RepID=A0A8H6XI86_9AGAR|nr:hypothetical protein MSAN_02051900 [Mycena sanguinolenta]
MWNGRRWRTGCGRWRVFEVEKRGLNEFMPVPSDLQIIPFTCLLPNLRELPTDDIDVRAPSRVPAQLTSFTLNLPYCSGNQSTLNAVLQGHAQPCPPQRIHIVVHADDSSAPVSTQPPLPLSLPSLRTLSVPWPAAGLRILPGALLMHLRVTSPIPTTGAALSVPERPFGTGRRTGPRPINSSLILAFNTSRSCRTFENARYLRAHPPLPPPPTLGWMQVDLMSDDEDEGKAPRYERSR